MESVFEITEPKREPGANREALLELHRRRWQAQQRAEELEAQTKELETATQALQERLTTIEEEKKGVGASLQDLRDQFVRADYQQRELLKGLARIVDECDDLIRAQTRRLADADPEDPVTRVGTTWLRRMNNTRANLMERLSKHGVTERTPVGFPNPDLDTIHSTKETEEAPPGEVVETLRRGLLWNGTILRYSEVIIAAPASSPSEETVPPQHVG